MSKLVRSLVLVALAACVAAPAFAQRDLIEIMRADLRTEKTAIVTQAMQLTEAQAEVFWPVYREYETEFIKLNDERLALIKEYAASYDSMTNEGAKSIIDRSFKLQEARTKTLKKYVGKMSKALDPKVAARWAQVEHALGSAIDLQIGSELPLLK
jgi:hypothetical protein